MAVVIPNLSDAAYPAQAFPNAVDLDIFSDGLAGDGIVTGCDVTAQGSPNMTVHVAAGSRASAGVVVAVSAVNPVVSAAAAHPRRDLVVINGAGTVSVVAGTPEPVVVGDPSVVPRLPAVPAGSVAIASLEVPGGASAISNAQILDKRAVLIPVTGTVATTLELKARKTGDQSQGTSSFVSDSQLVLPLLANEIWHVKIFLYVTTANISLAWAGPTGTTLALEGHISTGHVTWTALASNVTISSGGILSEGLVFVGGTAGNFTPSYQGSGGTTTVKANSTIWGAKLA